MSSGKSARKSRASENEREPSVGRGDEHEDEPPKTKNKGKKPPPSDDEEDTPLDDVKTTAEEFNFKIRQAASRLYQEKGRFPSNAEVADALGENEETIANAKKSLKLARQGQKLSGLRKSALKAGYSRRQGASRAELKGQDVEQSLITPSDVSRMARANPMDFSKGSYTEAELQMRLELVNEKLPVGSAREIIATIEPLFRDAMAECVERQARLRTSRITPSTMLAVLKKYNDLSVFTACVPAKGLVRYGKETGVDLVKRNDESLGWLMNETDENKKTYKAEKKMNKEAANAYAAVMEAEALRLANKRTSPGASAEAPVAKKKRKAVAA